MIKKQKQKQGFTIVELLVVVMVIGVLATIVIISYADISQRAIIASLKSDLFNASSILKMYQVEYGSFPSSLDGGQCPSEPVQDSKYCLKPSSTNEFFYTSDSGPDPQSFHLTAEFGDISYFITNNSSPAETPATPLAMASGGVISIDGNNTVHTFTANGVLNIISGGAISVDIKGGGGGGGAEYYTDYLNWFAESGGLSSVQIDSSSPYVAYGGGGGEAYEEGEGGSDGAPGSTIPRELNGVTGGALNGGLGIGGNGGAGGRVTGVINTINNQTLTVVVGSGGAGACYPSWGCGGDGGSGIVTFSYSN